MTGACHDIPLCASRYINVVTAVRGQSGVLQLLRESLSLRASARLLFVPDIDCYFIELDEVDRWENPLLGMAEAMSRMPFKAADILKAEIRSWSLLDYAHITDPAALQTLIDLSVITSENVDCCAVEARTVLLKRERTM